MRTIRNAVPIQLFSLESLVSVVSSLSIKEQDVFAIPAELRHWFHQIPMPSRFARRYMIMALFDRLQEDLNRPGKDGEAFRNRLAACMKIAMPSLEDSAITSVAKNLQPKSAAASASSTAASSSTTITPTTKLDDGVVTAIVNKVVEN